jgi:hypothetical protein
LTARKNCYDNISGSWKIEHEKEEGIKFMLLTNPVRLHGDAKNWIIHIEMHQYLWSQ